MSATDQAFAFGDNHNFVYVHGICDKFHINTTPKQAEYADTPLFPTGPYYPLVVATTGGDGSNNTGGTAAYYGNHTPVSEMGGPGGAFPYYAFPKLADFRSLLSHMPAKACQRTYRPTPPIAPEILRSMRVVGNIGYVVNNNSGGGGGGAAAAAVAAVMGGHHAAAAAAFAANGALLNSRRSRCFGVLF